MELKDILARCDHTLLAQTATWEDIKAICDDGMKYATASVCIPASFVKQAKEYVGDKLAICTVIGFPNGYATTASKCFMAHNAVSNGADEVDMVINIGWAKEGKWAEITEEIAQIKAHCMGRILKVIIETCLLTDEEKIALCKCVSDSGADYIKTSTGFSTAGATFADVELFAKHVAPHVKIKAACKGKLLKVIIETCLLTDEEKIALCKCVSDSGADYIKTSTGFSTAGATFADVELFKKHVAPRVKIKAAGGISSIADAEKFIALGADRLGTSRIVKIAKAMEAGKTAQNDGSY